MSSEKTPITVETTVNVPIEKTWDHWINPESITKWNSASDDWHTPKAENDLRVGGRFDYRMEAKDGSVGFDFGAVYDEVKPHELIAYTLDDGRKVTITFEGKEGETKVVETFDPENVNSTEMQQAGWQSILDNFKKFVESNEG
jgi:uncharacterized protein YndB with AHSA1/START domain